jgi:DNA-binding MltR family transcriptional regulator
VVLIFIALFTLPGQFTDIEHLVNSRSQFNNPYNPVQKGDNHIIVCGHVNNKQKLSAFLREFFHPDRMFSNSVQFHVVVLHPDEPR